MDSGVIWALHHDVWHLDITQPGRGHQLELTAYVILLYRGVAATTALTNGTHNAHFQRRCTEHSMRILHVSCTALRHIEYTCFAYACGRLSAAFDFQFWHSLMCS
jgi:hypothetical protein